MNSIKKLNTVFFNGIKDLCLLRIPQKYGQKKDGVDTGPDVLISHGLKAAIEELNIKIRHEEIIKPEIKMGITGLEICGDLCERIAKVVHEHSKKGLFIFNLGGDHSLATGTISGMLRTYPDLAVLWIDAHTDIDTVAANPDGDVHGMPVSFILNENFLNSEKPDSYKWCNNSLKSPSHISYIGIRQCDECEIEIVNKLKIPTFDMVAIDHIGINECIRKALDAIDPEKNRPIHVSFDIDSMDPMYIPSTGTRVDGGLTLREILLIAEAVHQTGRMVSLDVVEFNPKVTSNSNDISETAKNTLLAVRSFLGEKRPIFNFHKN